jgi:hypothetical protein
LLCVVASAALKPTAQFGRKQVEAGKQFVKETLAELKTTLNQPDIDNFEFLTTDKDFDHDQLSIFDPKKRRVVAKIARNDLADCMTTPIVKRRLVVEINTAAQAYFKAEK